MQNIGTNETSSTAGACVPTPATATSSPSVAAIEYAGAVDETPITTLDRKPIAPVFSPAGSATGATAPSRTRSVDTVVLIRLLSTTSVIVETNIVVYTIFCNY